MIAICIVLFAIVAAVMIYSVIRFRRRRDDQEDGPSIHGHTGLEITWTAIPFVLVTAIAIVCAIVLSRNDAQGANPLRVNVEAQQFELTFSYPDARERDEPRPAAAGQALGRAVHALARRHPLVLRAASSARRRTSSPGS